VADRKRRDLENSLGAFDLLNQLDECERRFSVDRGILPSSWTFFEGEMVKNLNGSQTL
jgi:hypothetical protein